MELRRLTENDALSCFACRLRGLELAPSAFGTTLDEERLRGIDFFKNILFTPGDDNVIFGVLSDDIIVGMVGIMRSSRPKTRHKASVWGMYLDKEFQGQGLGGQLLDVCIDHAKTSMGVSAIFLSVESSNNAAARLYESRGFRRWGVEPKALYFQNHFFSEDHMCLDLAKTDI